MKHNRLPVHCTRIALAKGLFVALQSNNSEHWKVSLHFSVLWKAASDADPQSLVVTSNSASHMYSSNYTEGFLCQCLTVLYKEGFKPCKMLN